MRIRLNAQQKKFRREHGYKRRPNFTPWLILVAIILVVLYFENSGKIGSAMTIEKHKQVKKYFEEVHYQHYLTNQMLVDLMERGKHDLSKISYIEFQNQLNKTDQVFKDAKVPKHFERYHDALVESMSIIHQITEAINYNHTYDYEKINLLTTAHNAHKASTNTLLADSFDRAKMIFIELENGGFQFHYYTEKRNDRNIFKR